MSEFTDRAGVEWADANPKPADGSTSDGYHTFDELYEYRMLYNAHAAHGWLAQGIPVVKSWRHADGEECFGGGWFIVTATLPAGQVSNHYEARHWGLFKVPEVELPPEWDGHTPRDAAMRLRSEAEHARPRPRTITRAEFMEALAAHVGVGSSGDWVTVEDMLVAAFMAVGIEIEGGDMNPGHEECAHNLVGTFNHKRAECAHEHRQRVYADDGIGTGPHVGWACDCCDAVWSEL